MNITDETLRSQLTFLYGAERAPGLLARVQKLLTSYATEIHPRPGALTQRDALLITYGDQVQEPGQLPLQTLADFCRNHLQNVVSGIHILPFYPWTSDDGFSVVDYRQIDPALGNWDDLQPLAASFRLMFDGVINHISAHSSWFQAFLQDDPLYRHYFITVEGAPDLSRVVRPRALPLLTSVQTPSGEKRVWTTFSADQVDLNFANPDVLLEILDILLLYAARGADFIRLDAIAYLWKEIGTSCIHLPQTHTVIQFLRAALDEVAPHVHLVSETNVPHSDNISYFGDGRNEAQLVYNFALPPLTLHTLHTGNAEILSTWAASLHLPSSQTTFFNFLASHDGIGLNPARGILPDAAIHTLVQKTLAHGGLISYKNNPDGSQSPYEMNINYFDALSDPAGNEPLETQVGRFMAAQAIMLALVGMPGIYFHSLFGSRGWPQGVQESGRNRTINRQKCQMETLQKELDDETSLRWEVFTRYCQLLSARANCPAFHPQGAQHILNIHPALFAVERSAPDGTSRALCLQNVSAEAISAQIPNLERATSLFSGDPLSGGPLIFQPYQTLWVQL